MPTREVITEFQMHSLLSVINTLQPYLLLRERDLDGEPSPKVDGGAQMAAVQTFVAVCQKIEDIVRQPKRWDTESHDKLYENIETIQKEQIALFIAQRRVAEKLERRSYNMNPEMRIIEGGQYIAFVGDLNIPGGAIIGMGPTPEKALVDLDEAFNRAPAQQLVVTDAPPEVDNPLPPCDTLPVPEEKPKRKRKSNDEA